MNFRYFQVSQAAAAAASSAVGTDMRHHLGQHNGGSTSGMPGHHGNQQLSQPDSISPDLGKSSQIMRSHGEEIQSSNKRVRLTASLIPSSGEALRLQEQRLEQALRLHGDPRALGFTLQHVVNQQNNQQP